MGLSCVPISSQPPLFTSILPPTMVRVLWTVRLKDSWPLTVTVEEMASSVSTITVSPAAMVVSVHSLGTTPHDQVFGLYHPPSLTLLKGSQVFQVTFPSLSYSCASPHSSPPGDSMKPQLKLGSPSSSGSRTTTLNALCAAQVLRDSPKVTFQIWVLEVKSCAVM